MAMERGYDPALFHPRLARRRGRLGRESVAVKLQLRVNEDMKDAIEARADREHTSASEIVRRSLREFLANDGGA